MTSFSMTGLVFRALPRTLCAVGLVAGLACSVPAQAARLADVASVMGVRSNQLVGYGLVVGLDGTGDQVRQTPFTQQSLTNMLSQLGVTVPQGTNMQVKNVAAVMVTAQLPAFTQPGQSLDVVVSSMGNAKSLRGGTLLMTPLKGANGQVYAMAQGNLLVGGAGADAGGSSVKVNQLNAGIITAGATVERAVPTTFNKNGVIKLDLHDNDFALAQNTVMAINRKFGKGTAHAVNARTIEVQGPSLEGEAVAFMSTLENLQVTRPVDKARVVINARTGSVVMNKAVTLDEVALTFGNLSITINAQTDVNQPDTPLAVGQTVVTQNTDVSMQTGDGSLKHLKTSANLASVVRALNTLGATPQDLLAIIQSLKSAGALHAELEII